jgi:hypothetical protein
MVDGTPLGEKSPTEDVGVPAQLLRATGNLGSLRDTRSSLSWEPQSAFPEINEKRRRTLPQAPHRLSATTTFSFHKIQARVPGSARTSLRDKQERTITHPQGGSTSPNLTQQEEQIRKSSFNRGSEEKLSVNRPTSTNASLIWTTDDPFSSTRDISSTQARSQSNPGHLHLQSDPSPADNVTTGKSCDQQQTRRGTLEAVVEALVPNIIQRRFTNSSFIRRSSIWQTYETAKKRSIELQRSKAFQLTFEYTIYAIIIVFVYFVLIGVPLWNGTVYWLWWVIAHKFVIAGGFAVTLGIAFL